MPTTVTDLSESDGGFQRCAWCRGIGRWNIAPGQTLPCIVCHGKGEIKVVQPPVYCHQCHGIGRETPTNPCLTCAGTGWEGVMNK